jgi:hypothetical protein
MNQSTNIGKPVPGDGPGNPSAMERKSPPVLTRFAIILSTVLVCLAILEIGLRVQGRYPMDLNGGYQEAGGLSYVLKKNVSKKVVWPTMSFTVHTSDLGYRAEKPGPQNIGEKPYYVVLGASDAFGNGLDYNETFVGVFAQKMQAHNIQVVNLAVAGHHLMEQEDLFKRFMASAPKPPEAVLVVFNPNLIGGFDDNHTNVVIKNGELFDKETWKVALVRKILSNTSTVYCFFRDAIRKVQKNFIGREDFALSFYIERFSSQHPIRRPERTAAFVRELKGLNDLIRKVNATPICIYCPPAGGFLLNDLAKQGKVDPSLFDTQFFVDIVANECQAEQVKFVNLEPPVQKLYDKGQKLNFDGDGHYNGPTSKVVGEYLYDVLGPRHLSAAD